MDVRRAARVAEAIRDELTELIGFELTDPRLKGVSVSRVEVSSDMRHASVMMVVPGTEAEQKVALKALDHAAVHLRHQLAARLDLRRTPELGFAIERWEEAPERVQILLQRAKKTRGRG
jgi:ribosome-binding factor A